MFQNPMRFANRILLTFAPEQEIAVRADNNQIRL